MKRFILPLLAALALPTAVNAEVIPKLAFGEKKSYSKTLYKGVIQKFANNYPLSEFHIYPDYNDRMNTVVEEIGDWLGKKL